MRRLLFAMFLSMAFCLLQSCSLSDDMDNGSQQQQPSQPQPQPDDETSDDEDIMEPDKIKITAGTTSFTAVLADNSSAASLARRLADGPLSITMSDYGDMEKVGFLGFTLPRNDLQMTTSPGDVILYQGSYLVIYYDVNTWSLTPVARVEGVTSREEMLGLLGGKGDVVITLSLE